MKIQFKEPLERTVVLEMTETQVRILNDLFINISGGGKKNMPLSIENSGLNYSTCAIRNTFDDFLDCIESLFNEWEE